MVSLKTRDKAEANRLKHGVIADLKKRIALELAGHSSAPQSARELLDFAQAERLRVDQGELSADAAEQSFDLAVDVFLGGESRRLGVDQETGHPMISEVDTKVIRAAHAVISGQGVTLLDQGVDAYLLEIKPSIRTQTLQEKRRHLGKFYAWAGAASSVRAITRRTAGQYVTKVLIPEDKAPKTTRDEIGNLSAFFNWLERRGEVDSNPFLRVAGSVRESTLGQAPRRRPWTNEELLKLLRGIESTDPLWPMAAIAAYSGMRREEVASMRSDDINGIAWSVTAAKNQSSIRTVPIHPVLRPLVTSLVNSSSDGYLISGLLTGGADEKRGHMVGKRFTKVRQRLGITDPALVFHTLRNAFIQRCEEAGVELSTAKRLSGHKRTDQTYGGYSPGGSMEMLEKTIRKVTFGTEVDEFVRRTGKHVTVDRSSRRRKKRIEL